MSILSRPSDFAAPSFLDFKKQASFFLREKIKTARLAFTDVTPAESLTEEAINGTPETRDLGSISRAAFEVDDYMRIVAILHQRFVKFEKKNWRISYNSLIVLERLLTHGPESISDEFQSDKDVIREMESFQYIDEKGFNWGLSVRRKSERIMKLLERESLLKEERDRARKLSREIQGFGSFSYGSSPSQEKMKNRQIQRKDEEQTDTGKLSPTQIAATQKDMKNNIVHKLPAMEESSQFLEGQIDDHRSQIVAVEDHPFANQTTVSLIV